MGGPAPSLQQTVPYRVVTHAANPVSEVARAELSQMFLGRRRAWRDGRPMLAVDLPLESPVRRSFTREVHGRTVAAIVSHWRQQIYLRRGSPPPQVDSEAAVLTFIRANPIAVGYVSADARLGADIKVLVVRP